MTTAVETNTFATEVLEVSQPVLVDFHAQWCGPCRAVAPVIDELAAEYEGRARVVKIDVDQAPEIAQQYGVSSIPAFFVFKDGEVKNQSVGVLARETLQKMIDEQL